MALSDKQRLVIDRFMENPMIDIGHIAESCGVRPATVYNWKWENKNGFKDALEQALAEKWERMKFKASETMEQLAEEGDYKASAYILNYHGYQPSTKIDAKVDAIVDCINLNINCEDTEN